MKVATHRIGAAWFQSKSEAEIIIENMETGEEVDIVFPISEKDGRRLSEIVPACVYWPAAIKAKD